MTISASALADGLFEIEELYDEGSSTPSYYPTPTEDRKILSRKNGGYLVIKEEQDMQAARGQTHFVVKDGQVVAFGEKI